MKSKQVRLAFCDLAGDWDPRDNYFTQILEEAGWQIIHCAGPGDDPDFVICGTFGHDFIRYSCCRIQFSGEDSWPDLNLYDYAMGFPLLEYGDRYLRLPLYAMRDSWAPAMKKEQYPAEFYLGRKFCNFVVSNDGCQERNQIFQDLQQYRSVDSGGGYANNIGGPVADKLAFQKGYKFSIAYENSATPGYCTEKIVDAFAAGTVPIYWGDPLVKEEFNPKAFLSARDFPDNESLIREIQRLDQDDQAYLELCRQPIFAPGCRAEAYATPKKAVDFLENIFAKGPKSAICRNQSHWGQNYQQDLAYYYELARQAAAPKSLLQRLGIKK